MKRNVKKSNNSKRRNDFSEFIDGLIKKYEDRPNSVIQINSLSNENTIEKRRLYDLLNVLAACDICTKTDQHNYIWNSIKNSKKAISRISYELECRSINETTDEIFILHDSPSIGLVTTRFIGIFLYLNIDTSNIRDAALFMSSDEPHYKTILRRLYLVAFLLERIGLFTRTQKNGEYKLNVDVKSICIKSLEKLARAEEFPPDSIEYQLNRFDQNYLYQMHSARRFNFVDRETYFDTSSTPGLAMSYIQGIDI
ncbi:hypothetical protein TRFO_30918 [Tritrichomonas foetus]|uniref:E2F/DP family winged-helix DNA-binding domain-containing protein n=1 Tax=Tritrichomonas foetus TaxID=1144522 RepID=A0A1J4JTH8_9EUKA|nr:hypothetical protein TRFO_30918 [Tritrichomonas foetus]|eukprot:OHT02050.1 hypothetical protein TRFO_30918 [Tritrichomonas foetus]